jgi:hypothetical protein
MSGQPSSPSRSDAPSTFAGRAKRPPVFEYLDDVRATNTRGAERAILNAAARWVDKRRELWPAQGLWASQAGLSRRGFQKALTRLVKQGLIEIVRHGPRNARETNRYRVVLGEAGSPSSRTACADAAHVSTSSGAPGARSRRTQCAQTTSELQENYQQRSGGVVASLPEQWQRHPKLTEELRDYIEREAPNARDPRRWAIAAIRDGYAVPETDESRKRRKAEEGAKHLEVFDAASEADQKQALEQAKRRCPGLANSTSEYNQRLLRMEAGSILAQPAASQSELGRPPPGG